MPIRIGSIGHFGLAVRDPKASARWWIKNLNLRKEFEFPGGVAVGNDAVTIVLFRGTPRPDAIDHMSFHVRSLAELRAALAELKRKRVALEDPGDEIGPESRGSRHLGVWFHDPDGYRWELSVQNALPRNRRRPRKRE